MLEIRDLVTGYGKKQVLYGLSIEVSNNEIVALIGPNGAGKSTILMAACGIIPIWAGEIVFNGISIIGSTSRQIISQGMTIAPQGNRVFPKLTVKENLEIGGIHLTRRNLDLQIVEVLDLFPQLRGLLKKKAGRLSGGEQQMVALARALIPHPKILLLDEPSLGLSPNLTKDVFNKILEINTEIGTSILIVEQKIHEVLTLSDKVYSIKMGRSIFAGSSHELLKDKEILKQLFL